MYTFPLMMRGGKGKAGCGRTVHAGCCWVALTVVACHHAALATSLGMRIVIFPGEFGAEC